MHEISIAQSMLELVAEQLGGPRRLVSATVTIGPLSGVDADALDFCWAEVAEEMGFGRPALVVNAVPARARCAACDAEYEMEDAFALCPECGAPERVILSGEEFTLDEVETETDP